MEAARLATLPLPVDRNEPFSVFTLPRLSARGDILTVSVHDIDTAAHMKNSLSFVSCVSLGFLALPIL